MKRWLAAPTALAILAAVCVAVELAAHALRAVFTLLGWLVGLVV